MPVCTTTKIACLTLGTPSIKPKQSFSSLSQSSSFLNTYGTKDADLSGLGIFARPQAHRTGFRSFHTDGPPSLPTTPRTSALVMSPRLSDSTGNAVHPPLYFCQARQHKHTKRRTLSHSTDLKASLSTRRGWSSRCTRSSVNSCKSPLSTVRTIDEPELPVLPKPAGTSVTSVPIAEVCQSLNEQQIQETQRDTSRPLKQFKNGFGALEVLQEEQPLAAKPPALAVQGCQAATPTPRPVGQGLFPDC